MTSIEAIYRVNPLQEQILLQAEWRSATIEARRRLDGRFDLSKVAEVWLETVRNEPVLRSSFVWEQLDRPVQVVHAIVPAEVRQCGARLPEPTVWDPTKPPLAECLLSRRFNGDLDLVVRAAPVLLDEVSIGLTLDRVFQALSGFAVDPPEESSLGHCWSALRDEDTADAAKFWRSHLEGYAWTKPPIDTGRKFRRLRRRAVRLDQAKVAALAGLAAELSVNLEAILLAAWSIVMSRYCGRSDVAVGLLIRGLPDGVDRRCLGRFANLLPVRQQVRETATVGDFIREMARVRSEVLRYRYCSQRQIAGWLGEYPAPSTAVSLIEPDLRDFRLRYAPTVPLEIQLKTGPISQLQALYTWPCFPRLAIANALDHLAHLLGEMATASGRPLASISLLGAAQHNRLARASSRPPQPYTQAWPGGVVRAFQQWAALRPDLTALCCEDEVISYGELTRRANKLARHLTAKGARPETLVAVLLDSPTERVVALLAIAKAGAAYMPIDSQLPADRISLLYSDSRAQLLLSSGAYADSLLGITPSVILIDREAEVIAAQSEENLSLSAITPDSLAYVIYTSGSTGTPKGSAIQHGSLFNMIRSTQRRLGMGKDVRALQFASLGFDASVFEIFSTLISGACLCLASRERMQPGQALQATVRDMAVSQIVLPPSALAVLDPEGLPGLQTLIIAGEACSPELVREWARPGRQLWNGYGPTESTVCVSLAALKPGRPVHLGTPLDGVSLYVLDSLCHLSSPLLPGELYIAGPGLARGYWHSPGLTAERFIPDPFNPRAGSRMYATGDRVVRQPDGWLEFRGRKDRQLKLRGFRIEPAEIEDALLKHDVVKQAAVTVRLDSGSPRLVAYIVSSSASPRGEGGRSDGLAQTLRGYLRRRLPAYMLPADFMLVEMMPMTRNGKIDYERLPPPATSDGGAQAQAETDTEKILMGIWQAVLPGREFGVHQSFFDVGGDSLLAAEVHRRICQALPQDISLIDLFKYPTIRNLATKVDHPEQDETPTDGGDKLRAGREVLRARSQRRRSV